MRWMCFVICSSLWISTVGCTSTKNRRLREPYVEEFTVPVESDEKVTQGPYYPDIKKQTATQKSATSPTLPAMRGGRSGGGVNAGQGGPF